MIGIRACVAAALCAVTATVSGQITNGGFEAPGSGVAFDGWSEFGSNGSNISQSTELVLEGMFAAKLFGQFTEDGMGAPTQNDTGIVQSISVTPNSLVEARVNVGVNSTDPLGTAEIGVAILGFFDAGGVRISEVVQDVANSSTPANDMFTEFVIQGTAPSNAVSAELLILHVQLSVGTRGGAVYYDDVSLDELPAGAGLKNPSFDQEIFASVFESWNETGNLIGNIEQVNFFPFDGEFNFKVFGQFIGADNESFVSQDVAVTPGDSYTASVVHAQVVGDGLAAGNFGFLDVTFLDGAGVAIGATDRTITAQPSDPPATFATASSGALVAPAGAVTARVSIGLFQSGFAGGAIQYDNAILQDGMGMNLLSNGSFETLGAGAGGIFGWETIGDNNFIEPTAPCDGPSHLKTFGGFTGAENAVGVFQDLSANPGAGWEAGIQSLQDFGDFLQGDNVALLRLIFLDAGGAELAFDEVIVGDDMNPLNTCEMFMLSATAPAGTATARIELLLVQDAANSGGSIFLDGAFLECVSGDCSVNEPVTCAPDITVDGACTPGAGDGVVTLSDFSCYLSQWAASAPIADITLDGTCDFGNGGDGVTLSDFSCYLAEWAGGCDGDPGTPALRQNSSRGSLSGVRSNSGAKSVSLR
ncbi:MAG: GC-type dockerin domain-anchored protein [Planctomycetota bacterium]